MIHEQIFDVVESIRLRGPHGQGRHETKSPSERTERRRRRGRENLL
jgi:hypothetical protein